MYFRAFHGTHREMIFIRELLWKTLSLGQIDGIER